MEPQAELQSELQSEFQSESKTPSPAGVQEAFEVAEPGQGATNIETGQGAANIETDIGAADIEVDKGSADIVADKPIADIGADEPTADIDTTEAAPSSNLKADSFGTAEENDGPTNRSGDKIDRGHWKEDEVIELIKAHMELDPDYHIMRGVQGSNYYGELYQMLMAKFPDFRHTEGAVKTKLFRLKGQYLQLRDRFERTGSTPRNLPEWFVLMDAVMARESGRAGNQQGSRVNSLSSSGNQIRTPTSGRMTALMTSGNEAGNRPSSETPAYAFPVTPSWPDTAGVGQNGSARNSSLSMRNAASPLLPLSSPSMGPTTFSPFAGGVSASGNSLLSFRNTGTPGFARGNNRLMGASGGLSDGRKRRGSAGRGMDMLTGGSGGNLAAVMGERLASAMAAAVRNACFQFEELTREMLENACSQFEELSRELAENACAQFEELARELAESVVSGQDSKRRRR